MIEMLNRKREVIKPWGKEVIWAETKDYVGKLLYINEGHKLSLQYHEEKEETILVVSGELEIFISGHGRRGLSSLKLSEGDTYHVTPNTIHRFSASLGTNVVIAEVSTNHLDDVVRLQSVMNPTRLFITLLCMQHPQRCRMAVVGMREPLSQEHLEKTR